jgi:MYXO-CTERM domain-containing protein
VPTAFLSNWPFELCFANPGFGITCASDDDCKLGDYCDPNGQCHVDDRTSCLACVSCTASEECGPRAQCLDPGDGSGDRCIVACYASTDCPGDSICGEVPYRNRLISGCVSPSPGASGEICNPDYVCSVKCRGDLPCADGLVCSDSGMCVEPPPSPAKKSGCSCGATGTELPGLLAIGLVLLARRRRPPQNLTSAPMFR